ncbi:hypothetical protein AB0J21_06035 [Streptomyces sp. NPDC049954]|uniref:hypothetical protein n=1 Tax=Streptomyces sp. NPDC049954 TaxID=3155779 RepID=UPI003415DFD2
MALPPGLAPVTDLTPCAWVADALAEGGDTVAGGVLPGGYEAYVRLPHPVDEGPEGDGGDADGTWAAAAVRNSTVAHPLAQWERIALDRGEHDPPEGELDARTLAALVPVLAAHTATPEDCLFGVWDGYFGGRTAYLTDRTGLRARLWVARRRREERERNRRFAALPALATPGRDYLFLRGPVTEAERASRLATGGGLFRRGPNLWWPADRAWCVASEIDFSSTYVGGSARLARALLGHERLEAWPASPGDLTTLDADTVNPPRP